MRAPKALAWTAMAVVLLTPLAAADVCIGCPPVPLPEPPHAECDVVCRLDQQERAARNLTSPAYWAALATRENTFVGPVANATNHTWWTTEAAKLLQSSWMANLTLGGSRTAREALAAAEERLWFAPQDPASFRQRWMQAWGEFGSREGPPIPSAGRALPGWTRQALSDVHRSFPGEACELSYEGSVLLRSQSKTALAGYVLYHAAQICYENLYFKPSDAAEGSSEPSGGAQAPADENGPPRADPSAAVVEAQEAPRAAATARVEPERPPGPVASWQGTARAAATPAPAAWLLLVFLAFLLLPALLLYSRLRRQDVLANATRAALCELVRARPGLAAGGLARALARNRTSVLHHLRVLRGAGLVEARVVGRRTRYFPAGSGDDDAQRRVRVALASPVARRVALHLALRGADSLGAIARATGVPKSTVRWHVNRLARLGAFSDEGVFDRERVLRALPPAPAPEAATEAGVSPS